MRDVDIPKILKIVSEEKVKLKDTMVNRTAIIEFIYRIDDIITINEDLRCLKIYIHFEPPRKNYSEILDIYHDAALDDCRVNGINSNDNIYLFINNMIVDTIQSYHNNVTYLGLRYLERKNNKISFDDLFMNSLVEIFFHELYHTKYLELLNDEEYINLIRRNVRNIFTIDYIEFWCNYKSNQMKNKYYKQIDKIKQDIFSEYGKDIIFVKDNIYDSYKKGKLVKCFT